MVAKKLHTRLVFSHTFDPWFNLALEEFLLRRVREHEIILYLWQNENTVVIGRNQNAWKECRCAELESAGGKLARRLSGGGAVFHDLGNLNFTFLTTKEQYDVHKQLQAILEGVRILGLNAQFSGRNDLVIDGRKFSGNAYYYEGNLALHHGTIMVKIDLTKLSRYLQVSPEKMRSKGIDSIQSRVVNLADLKSDVTISKVKQAIIQGFAQVYGQEPKIWSVDTTDAALSELYAKYSSWSWRYGRTPTFEIQFQHRFSWGEMDIYLHCTKGSIADAVIFSDAMDAALIQQMAKALKGQPFQFEAVRKALTSLAENMTQAQIINDVLDWLRQISFWNVNRAGVQK